MNRRNRGLKFFGKFTGLVSLLVFLRMPSEERFRYETRIKYSRANQIRKFKHIQLAFFRECATIKAQKITNIFSWCGSFMSKMYDAGRSFFAWF